MDLTKEDEIILAFKWIEENLGGIHVLVNNAGSVVKMGLLEGNFTKK